MGSWVTVLLKSEFSQQASLSVAAGRDDPLEPLLDSDVIIDFSSPQGTLALVRAALSRTKPSTSSALPAFVIGSTGWTDVIDSDRKLIDELATRTPVLMASNFSTGVLALQHILRLASPLLGKLGYTPVIVETHHKHKKDAPSGTAISLQRAIDPEDPAGVQTHAIRGGEIIGDHEVTYFGTADHITLGHFAQDRSIFARGSINVALWLAGQRGMKHGGLVPIENYVKGSI
jgi:4-hydroxy-tetrahydrodipicolinate reductase